MSDNPILAAYDLIQELQAKLEKERANHARELAEAWQRGYDRAEQDMPDCATPCGACEQCAKPPSQNPY